MPILCTLLAALALNIAQLSGSETMHAIRFHEHGGREVLRYEEAPRPTPAEGELIVRVIAAGVNPVDAKIRQNGWRGISLPFTPGFELAGTIEEVGPGVSHFKKGDPVYACLPLDRGGGYAEFAIVREQEAAPKPQKATFPEAAAVGVTALTAWQALFDTADLQPGQTVLIHGGSGGVGTVAIQLAKWKGARVIATASTRNQQYLKELGADVTVDYTAQRFEDFAKEVDVVLDAVGGETRDRSIGVLKRGGILITIAGPPVPPAVAREAGIRATGMLVKRSGDQLREIGAIIDSGDLKIVVSSELPLTEAAKAHEQIETRHTRGKIVLKIADPPMQPR